MIWSSVLSVSAVTMPLVPSRDAVETSETTPSRSASTPRITGSESSTAVEEARVSDVTAFPSSGKGIATGRSESAAGVPA